MAGNKIRVNTQSLNRTRTELQAALDKVRKHIEQIEADMAALNAAWDGDAHQTFEQKVNDDIQFLSGACEEIQYVINYEDTAVREYDRCEQQVSELIKQIRI